MSGQRGSHDFAPNRSHAKYRAKAYVCGSRGTSGAYTQVSSHGYGYFGILLLLALSYAWSSGSAPCSVKGLNVDCR